MLINWSYHSRQHFELLPLSWEMFFRISGKRKRLVPFSSHQKEDMTVEEDSSQFLLLPVDCRLKILDLESSILVLQLFLLATQWEARFRARLVKRDGARTSASMQKLPRHLWITCPWEGCQETPEEWLRRSMEQLVGPKLSAT